MEKTQIFCLGSRITLSTGSSGSSTGFCATAAGKTLSWPWKGSPQRTEPGKSRAGTGGGEQRVWVPSEVRGGLGGSPRSVGDCGLLCSGEGLAGCGWPPAISHPPEGDMRCKWAITSTTPHRNSTWAPTYRHHPAWEASCSSPLSSLPTMANQGLEITRLYLRHHFHIICL